MYNALYYVVLEYLEWQGGIIREAVKILFRLHVHAALSPIRKREEWENLGSRNYLKAVDVEDTTVQLERGRLGMSVLFLQTCFFWCLVVIYKAVR